MRIQHLLVSIFLVFLFSCSNDKIDNKKETVFDADGNIYNTIKIGNQTWTLENLKTTRFNDGSPITEYTFASHGNNWLNLNTPEKLFQWADTSDLNNVVDEELPKDYYGAMYNHLAIESGKLAPKGWRIPSVEDFKELESYLRNNGYSDNEATALKSSTGWLPSSGNGINAVGFNGLPNGYVHALGGPTLAEGITTWATSNVNLQSKTRTVINLYNEKTILYSENAIQLGAGIRCIKE